MSSDTGCRKTLAYLRETGKYLPFNFGGLLLVQKMNFLDIFSKIGGWKRSRKIEMIECIEEKSDAE